MIRWILHVVPLVGLPEEPAYWAWSIVSPGHPQVIKPRTWRLSRASALKDGMKVMDRLSELSEETR